MTVPEVMTKRFNGELDDAQALAALIATGETEQSAREMMELQDELLTEDNIDEADPNAGS